MQTIFFHLAERRDGMALQSSHQCSTFILPIPLELTFTGSRVIMVGRLSVSFWIGMNFSTLHTWQSILVWFFYLYRGQRFNYKLF